MNTREELHRRVSEICFGTSVAFPAGELEPDAAVELQGDESVGRHHDDAGDEEEQQQQGHVPAKGGTNRRRKRVSQPSLTSSDLRIGFPGRPSLAGCFRVGGHPAGTVTEQGDLKALTRTAG